MGEAVTIYIIGHGEENIQVPFNNNDETLKLLSFVGTPGKIGELFKCQTNNEPIDKVVNFNIYNQLLKNYSGKISLNNQEQNNFFTSCRKILENIYETCGYPVEDGFSLTYPLSERYFFFEPNEHENCRLCSDPENFAIRKEYDPKITCCPSRCLGERNRNNLDCPEYGLVIVCSSFPQDARFTLLGGSFEERYNANINLSLSNKAYWKSRAAPSYKYLIDQIYDLKEINMTDLNLLFKSMGFNDIYIFDPTCRQCEIDAAKVEEYKLLERTRPSERPILSQPTNTIPYNYKPNPKTNYFDDCINGVCGYFNKKKVDGGRKRRKTKKVFKNKKIKINRKTRKVFKNKKIKRKTRKFYL